ncbi:unnamed protein product [Oppiella nova]|uniref:CHCH domain-containing protein n=1 Tax=Oppiella nova TaxID=334625 RepID=A0A7R9QFV7_9ACAR|nr:unnamed protein product [Oppiella nova]CAG2165001.1 unnamed protein product [Oppiella nova]
MSYCQQIGKDRIIFATKEDHSTPSTVELGDEPRDASMRGLILEDGSINWNCPCLGGMASGPCGYQFREAFSCFHYSEAETKGSECIEKFAQMQDCMTQYPNLYPNNSSTADDQPFPDDGSAAGDSLQKAIEPIGGKDVTSGEGSGEQKSTESKT